MPLFVAKFVTVAVRSLLSKPPLPAVSQCTDRFTSENFHPPVLLHVLEHV